MDDTMYFNAWLIDTRDFIKCIDEIRHCLSAQELKKNAEITTVKQRDLYCMRKGITRILLSRLFDLPACDLQYAYDPNGKPYIENYKNIKFNISHSKEYLLVGIAEKAEIGVDIEKINYKLNYTPIANSIFAAEELDLFKRYNETQQLQAFYKAWVQKEAVSKALGLGLAMGFNSFSVSMNPELNKEEYHLKINKGNICLKLMVSLERNYAMAIALVEKEWIRCQ